MGGVGGIPHAGMYEGGEDGEHEHRQVRGDGVKVVGSDAAQEGDGRDYHEDDRDDGL